jgi:hypothetical protein
MATYDTTVRLGQIIFEVWEGGSGEGVQARFQNRQLFVNYVLGFVMRIGPSLITLLHGLIYTLRLRSAFPQSRGQVGCAHRMFVVALLVAAKHCQDPRLLIEPDYADWSTLSGLFEVEELRNMEIEFILPLQRRLSCRLSDLETVISRCFLGDSTDRAVPGAVDLFSLVCIERKRLAKRCQRREGDAVCPCE